MLKLRKSIKTLERRRQWLVTRIERGERNGEDLSFDRAERDALDISIRLLRGFYDRQNDPALTYTFRTLLGNDL